MSVQLRNFIPNAYIYPNTTSSYRRSILAFLHSPKSGGLSVRDCLLKLYHIAKKDRPLVVAFSTVSEVQENLLNNISSPNDYYMGDSVMGICDHVTNRDCSYFTMMRDPYDRAISHYLFCQSGRGGQTPSCNTTLIQYTLSQCSLYFRQMTSRMLCSHSNGDTQSGSQTWICDSKPTSIDHLHLNREKREQVLHYFLDNLDKIFTVIGLTEEFETSLRMFQKIYEEPFEMICRGNHANAGSYLEGNKDDIQEEYRKQLMANDDITRCLHEDIKLYEKATEIFQIQARSLSL